MSDTTIRTELQEGQRFRSAAMNERIAKAIAVILLIIGALIFATPFLTALNMSLKSEAEVKTTNAFAVATHPSFDNYKEVLSSPNVSLLQCFWNTFTIAALATLGVMFSSSLVAYAFARLKFRGRDRLFIIMLSTMMVPPIIMYIPNYVVFSRIHWINSFLPLIVPAWFGGGAFNIFLLRQFFMGIPRELDEAALLDGASHFTIWSRIIMPLSKTALATVGVFAFIYNWKDFLGPLIYENDNAKQTLELGLSTYNQAQQQKWHLLMAASVMVMIPLIIIFFLGQRYFVKGIVMSGIK